MSTTSGWDALDSTSVSRFRAEAERLVGQRGDAPIDPQDAALALEALAVAAQELRVLEEELDVQREQVLDLHEPGPVATGELWRRSPVAQLLTDENGYVLQANDEAGAALGSGGRRLVGRPLSGHPSLDSRRVRDLVSEARAGAGAGPAPLSPEAEASPGWVAQVVTVRHPGTGAVRGLVWTVHPTLPEQRSPALPDVSDTDRLVLALGAIASTVLAGLDAEGVVAAEAGLLRAAIAAVPHVDGASFSLPGIPTAGSTSPEVRRADLLQFDLREGPCLDTLRTGSAHLSSDLEADPAWPRSGPLLASDCGFHSVLAVPLVSGGRAVGALNLYARARDAFDAASARAAATLAEPVGTAVSDAHTSLGQRRTSDELRAGLDSRSTIGQAIGLLMAGRDLDAEGALDLLKRRSQHENRKLRDVAAKFVADFQAALASNRL